MRIAPVDIAVRAQSALGFIGRALGAIADMRGWKQALVGALLLFSVSLLAIGIWPAYAVLFVGLVNSGGVTVVIDSAIHALSG